MNNYIIFYVTPDNNIIAEIHNNGTCRRIRNERNLKKLIQILSNYDIHIKENVPISKNIRLITKEYDKYINKKKRKIKIFNTITGNMKINNKSKTGKIIATTALITTLALTHNISTLKEPTLKIDKPTEIELILDDVNDEVINEVNNDLEQMINDYGFHYSYEDRSNSNRLENARKYEDIFEKYATIYGLDKNLLMAIAAQESSGDHYNHIDKYSAEGIMQIEKSVYIGHTLHAYNFETGEVESLKITNDNLKDLETNIKAGAMIYQNYLEHCNYNIPLALQEYNFGPGNMNTILGNDRNYYEDNPTNNEWLKNRNLISAGDSKYIEHVFSFLPTDNLTVKTRDNKEKNIKIINDYKEEKTQLIM